MAGRPPHIEWLQDTGERLATVDRRVIELWELRHVDDSVILSAWAAHFRHHYCSDTDLPDFVAGTGKTAAEYLVSIKFPDVKAAPGPSVRAGDFAEILVRAALCRKAGRDEGMFISDRTKGCCSIDLNEPPHLNHDQFAELDAHN